MGSGSANAAAGEARNEIALACDEHHHHGHYRPRETRDHDGDCDRVAKPVGDRKWRQDSIEIGESKVPRPEPQVGRQQLLAGKKATTIIQYSGRHSAHTVPRRENRPGTVDCWPRSSRQWPEPQSRSMRRRAVQRSVVFSVYSAASFRRAEPLCAAVAPVFSDYTMKAGSSSEA